MNYMTTENREIIRLAITPKAKELLDSIAKGRDMKLIGVSSRIIEWFVKQDYTLQSIILGMVANEDKAGVLQLIEKRSKEEQKQPGSPDPATQAEANAKVNEILGEVADEADKTRKKAKKSSKTVKKH